MTKLDKAVAIAMGMEVQQDKDDLWWVKVNPHGDREMWTWIEEWTYRHKIADKLMDDHKIETEYFGRRWCATCEGVSAQHQDRKTAALMAFCKFKGVSYE